MSFKRKLQFFRIFSIFANLNFYIPVKLLYFQHLTQSYSLAASIISLSWIFSAIFEVPTGVFSDMVGRKKTIILGCIFGTLAYTLYAAGSNYWILVVGAALDGASRAFFSGNNNAYLHNLLTQEGKEEEFHNYFGKLNSLATASFAIATFSSGFLLNWSYSLMMWGSVFSQLAALVVSFWLPEVKLSRCESSNVFAHLKEALIEVKNNANLRLLSLANILGGAGMAAYEFQSAVIGLVWPLWAVGIARALQEIVDIPGYYFAGRLINKFKAPRILFFATIQSWVSNIIAGAFPSVLSPIFIASSAFFYGPSHTSSETLIQEEFTEKQRATIASLNSLGNSLYFAAINLLVGIFANFYGPFKALLLTQFLFIPVIYIQWLVFKRLGKVSGKNPTPGVG